jgi:hypothetical protein
MTAHIVATVPSDRIIAKISLTLLQHLLLFPCSLGYPVDVIAHDVA